MPRIKLLVSALALGLASTSATQAQEFSAVVSFGDSLSDAGQYAALPPPYYFGAQGSFTTNPDDVWTQILAASFGLTQTPSVAGGTNYAWGGAPTSFSVPGVPVPLFCVPATLPCDSVAEQIAAYGTIDPNALYTYWAGANDIFNYVGYAAASAITSAQAQQYTALSAANAIGQIGGLQDDGANYIVVLNLPDIGRAPNFTNATLFPTQASPAASQAVSGLVYIYNTQLNAGLASLADGIIPINAFGLVNEILADPSAFGFTNTTATACNLALTGGSSLFCTPAAYVSPDANLTYLFADGVHPSGAAHAMLAKVVVATIQAPGQVSMAAELPLQVYDNHSNVINQQVFGMNREPRSEGESNVYGELRYNRHDFEQSVNTQAFDSRLITGTFGGDVRFSDHFSLGASFTYGNSSGESFGSSVDANEVLISGYGVAHLGAGYLNAIITGGTSSLEIDRAIELGPTTRIERGDTNAKHLAFEVGGGFSFGSEDFRHGPFASVTWQRVDVDGYAENSQDSTSMWFSDFERESTVGRIGYRIDGHAGSLQPFGSIAWAKEDEDTGSSVQAGSNTMNGHFTFDGFLPSEDWVEADVGLNYQMNDKTMFSFAYRARLNDDGQDMNSLAVGVRMEFGGAAPAPAPEPVQAATTTCAELDDDGDGVNNCDDKCPGSTAGQPVGAYGCAVPAPEPEPEPVMEAKPYRN